MNDLLKKTLKHIKEYNHEIHVDTTYGELYIIVDAYAAKDFLQIITTIDDGGCSAKWNGGYFTILMNGFLECDCEVEIGEFIDLLNLMECYNIDNLKELA